ncbi:MAG: ATP-binding protein, partial [Paludibacteraceae bacterium]|nr:ATP-binding protein [Paludibacteraceae bacterium]
MIERKIDTFLKEWKEDSNKKPLIVKGARQIGKTFSIMQFATSSYKYVVNINFALQEKFKTIFNDGFDVDSIINNITLLSPSIKIEAGNTLIFFDELQACPNCATSLKSFAIDGRYDVICSGSLMGINYHEIESNSVGYKTDYEMHSLDFEEFLWAKGYSKEQVESIYSHLKDGIAFSSTELEVWFDCFKEYMIVGGMPEIVQKFVSQKNYSGILEMQKQLLLDYEEDITKYAFGLDKGKIKNVYYNISVFLAKENKKYQISKISRNARNRDYIGTTEWLADAGIISPCYCLETLELPLKGYYNPQNYKLYYKETSLLIAS